METALAHRGGSLVDRRSSPEATLSLREAHGDLCIGSVSPGIHEFPDQ